MRRLRLQLVATLLREQFDRAGAFFTLIAMQGNLVALHDKHLEFASEADLFKVSWSCE
jgi:hypothetical protein